MKNLFVLSLLSLFVLVTSCKQDKSVNEPTPGAREIPTMADVSGTFKGDLPCEDCDKEIVTLRFLMDKTVFKTVARVNGNGSSAHVGTWELEGHEVHVRIKDEVEFFKLKGKELQKEIDGKVYSLTKLEN